jgi:hypothetical protein
MAARTGGARSGEPGLPGTLLRGRTPPGGPGESVPGGPPDTGAAAARARPRWALTRALARSRAARHAALLAFYLTAGVALTWPRAAYLAGRLPATRDVGGYVWGFWWVAHQLVALRNPWSTGYLAAPVGAQLGFHTLMPLPGLLMAPVTLAYGPSASYNLLSIACPGLLCYVMCRAARLWLPSRFDAVTAGAFFGLSAILAWRSWYEVNLALGALFLPMALEAAVRLSRRPAARQAIILGLVLGAAMLTDQESAVLAAIVAGLALLPWLARERSATVLRPLGVTAGAFVLAASPQIIAMLQQAAAGGASTPLAVLAKNYDGSGASLVQLVAPSPRLASYGLTSLAAPYYQGRASLAVVGYGSVLTLLALAGLVTAWRRPAARLLALLWLGCSALALGSAPWVFNHPYVPAAQMWNHSPMSLVMPYTWFVRIPGLANFREADRFTELGLVGAALLVGAAVGWLRARAKPVLVVALALAAFEAGWSGNPAGHEPVGVMPTAMPRLDGPIAADHSGSIVVDVPFGIRGGLPVAGAAFPPETMVLATADSHPLGDAFISRIPPATITGIQGRAFYAGLMRAQGSHQTNTPARLRAARLSARAMRVGWVLVWSPRPAILRFLRNTGFRLAYEADHVWVYRPGPWSAIIPAAREGSRPGCRAGPRQPVPEAVRAARRPGPPVLPASGRRGCAPGVTATTRAPGRRPHARRE